MQPLRRNVCIGSTEFIYLFNMFQPYLSSWNIYFLNDIFIQPFGFQRDIYVQIRVNWQEQVFWLASSLQPSTKHVKNPCQLISSFTHICHRNSGPRILVAFHSYGRQWRMLNILIINFRSSYSVSQWLLSDCHLKWINLMYHCSAWMYSLYMLVNLR